MVQYWIKNRGSSADSIFIHYWISTRGVLLWSWTRVSITPESWEGFNYLKNTSKTWTPESKDLRSKRRSFTCIFQVLESLSICSFPMWRSVVRASSFHLWDRGFNSCYYMTHVIYVTRISQRSAKSRGFSPGAPVSSRKENWQGVLG
jgi:hypothetical protein